MIRSNKELIDAAKYYFGKDRKELKKKLLSFTYNGSKYRRWKNFFAHNISRPLSIEHGIFDDVVKNIVNNKIRRIDWLFIGDLSWKIPIVLNRGIHSIFDNDKLLAKKCGGKVKYIEIFISDIVPAFTYDKYYMIYNEKENYYQFGPLNGLSSIDKTFIKKIKRLLVNEGYFYVNKPLALKRYKMLTSDLNHDGYASIYDCLFRDTDNYQSETVRVNAESIKITGNYPYESIGWKEFYTSRGTLIRREEWRHYKSRNIECVYTDNRGKIFKVKVWGGKRKKDHNEFKLNIFKI